MAYMAIALGISTALINLVGTWPKLLPFGEKKDNVPSNRKSRTENNDDNFDISEYIKEKYQ